MSETVNQKTASQRLLTAEDLYMLPDNGTIQELLEGCLLSEPLPGARHGRIGWWIRTLSAWRCTGSYSTRASSSGTRRSRQKTCCRASASASENCSRSSLQGCSHQRPPLST